MEHLPSPSMWPATIGAGVALLMFGVVTSLVLSALGALLLGYGLVGWIQELRHD
jgi:hypothetical protein